MRSIIWILASVLWLSQSARSEPSSFASGREVSVASPSQTVVAPAQPDVRFAWERAPVNNPFREGSVVAVAYGSRANDSDNKVRMYAPHIGIGYYFQDNLSVNLEIFGIYGDRLLPRLARRRPVDEAPFYATATQGLMRYHFLNSGSWSLFADAGVGVAYLSKSVPTNGTNANFIVTAGLGMTEEICENLQLLMGCRWFHLSNAGLLRVNPGFDSTMLYAGFLYHY